MIIKILFAGCLVVVTVFIHAVGFSVLLRAIMRSHALNMSGFGSAAGLLVSLTCWLILIHLTEISVWGLFYLWQGCMPDAESAWYFSGVTYTGSGYGDIVLSKEWRKLAPVETTAGLLMCGLSTGLFFAIVQKWISNWMNRRNEDISL
jgi:hypothetical protein